jgi:hypothetical protein
MGVSILVPEAPVPEPVDVNGAKCSGSVTMEKMSLRARVQSCQLIQLMTEDPAIKVIVPDVIKIARSQRNP